MTPAHPIVPPYKLPSSWRESAESHEGHAESLDHGVDRAEWEAMATQLRECADDLERSMAGELERRQADAGSLLNARATLIVHVHFDGSLVDAPVAWLPAVVHEHMGDVCTVTAEEVVPRVHITPGVDTLWRVWVDDIVGLHTNDASEALAYVSEVRARLDRR